MGSCSDVPWGSVESNLSNTNYRLLVPGALVLKCLGQHIAFEVAVGVNGRVWVKSGSVRHTLIAVNALQKSEFVSDDECKKYVENLILNF